MQVVLVVAMIGRNIAEVLVLASTMILLNVFAPKASIGSINGAGQTLINLGELASPPPFAACSTD